MSFKTSSKIISEKMRSQSDRYHQQRLSQIRNSKNKDSQMIKHLNNRKGAQKEQERLEQIEKENAFLLDKMSRIMEKKPEAHLSYSSKSKKPHPLPDLDISRERERITSVKSSYSQERQLCSWMNNRLLKLKSKQTQQSQSKQSPPVQSQQIAPNPARQSFEHTMKLFEDLHIIGDPREKKDQQDIFNKPEEIWERIVLYKKSLVADEKSLLIQISTAFSKLIILVFDMTKPSKIRRLVLGERRTRQLLNENAYNFEQIANQILITKDSVSLVKRHNDTALNSKRQDTTAQQHSLAKSPAERQTEFLQRNFYQEVEKRKDKDRPTLPFKTPQSHNSHRLNVSHNIKPSTHQVKPATAANALRKKIQFQIPDTQNKNTKGRTPTINQEKTQSDLIQNSSKDSFQQGKKKPYIKINRNQLQFKKSKTELKEPNKLTNKQYANGGQHQEPKQMQEVNVAPKKQNTNPPQNYDEYINEFDPEIDYQARKPQSREQQMRKTNAQRQGQQKSSSQLQDDGSDLKDYEEDGYEFQDENQQGAKYGPHEEENQEFDEYAEDFQENAQQSIKRSKALLKVQRQQGIYEEDFEISKSKV